MKIKNSQLEALALVLQKLSTVAAVRLSYFVAMNLQRLQPHLEALGTVRKPSPDFQAFTHRHDALCVEYADKDVTGRPLRREVSTPGGKATVYDILKQKEEFEAALRQLESEFQDARDQRMKQEQEIHTLLQEEVEVELVNIWASQCPDEILTGDTVAVLMAAGLMEWDLPKPGGSKED